MLVHSQLKCKGLHDMLALHALCSNHHANIAAAASSLNRQGVLIYAPNNKYFCFT